MTVIKRAQLSFIINRIYRVQLSCHLVILILYYMTFLIIIIVECHLTKIICFVFLEIEDTKIIKIYLVKLHIPISFIFFMIIENL